MPRGLSAESPGADTSPAAVPAGATAHEALRQDDPARGLSAGGHASAKQDGVPLIFELSRPGRRGVRLPDPDVPAAAVPDWAARSKPPDLPEVSELDVVRHFTRLSQRNYGVDTGFYPLGSCTMKYSPRLGEWAAALPGFADLHPYAPEDASQGALRLLWELERALGELTGMARFTLQPAAGAHGELTGMLIVRAYHAARGEGDTRTRVIVPDAAHGTNPASAAMCGYEVVEVPSDARGGVDLAALESAVDERTAALMLTNPNTLGLFEENIERIAALVHAAGGLLYYDGANANAILGRTRPGDMGFDVVHLNLHKTFSTPHGMGGPGAGPVGVAAALVDYLPVPLVERDGERYRLRWELAHSIGRVKAWYGNFGVLVRAYAYILACGGDGLKAASTDAVLAANYLQALLAPLLDLPFDRRCLHEFVLSARGLKARTGVRALDVAKRLLDYGFHPPTVYFPLIVEEALMFEPTETESKETLDAFAAAVRAVLAEAAAEPELVRHAPHTTVVGRLDEATAARKPVVRWRPSEP